MREKRFSPGSILLHSRFFSNLLHRRWNIAPGKLNCSSVGRLEMDSTRSKDASYVGKAIARFPDRASSSYSKVQFLNF